MENLAEMTRTEVYTSAAKGAAIARLLPKLPTSNVDGFRFPHATAVRSFRNGFEDAARHACDWAGINDIGAGRHFVYLCQIASNSERAERKAS